MIGEYAAHQPELDRQVSWSVYATATHLTDADIECHEGRRIVFVHPVVARCLELAPAAVVTLAAYLDSDHYRAHADVV